MCRLRRRLRRGCVACFCGATVIGVLFLVTPASIEILPATIDFASVTLVGEHQGPLDLSIAPTPTLVHDTSDLSIDAAPTSVQSFSGLFVSYENVPVTAETNATRASLEKALSRPVARPLGLRHRASPPGNDVVMGLAMYERNQRSWGRLIGSLRHSGYDGHVIMGVHPRIPKSEEAYLQDMDVTYYEVELATCAEVVGGGGGTIRSACAKGLPNLSLEWGRFEMARQWLRDCETCTGWALVMDTRDVYFQAHPFKSLPPPQRTQKNLLFIEEVAKHTSPTQEEHRYFKLNNGRYKGRTEGCYGKGHWTAFGERPVLCSGTVIGNRNGIERFLSVLVDEFYANNLKNNTKCKSPVATDQWTMNYLFYTGRFGEYGTTATLPWGTGPVLTVGKPCVNDFLKAPSHSQKDMLQFDERGFVLNNNEKNKTIARLAAVVHQYDRCHLWVEKFFRTHKDMYALQPKLAWKETGLSSTKQ